MTIVLQKLGYSVNRKRQQRLMRELGIEAIYPKPNLSKVNSEHQVYPYLLKGLTIENSNQVWGTDINILTSLERRSRHPPFPSNQSGALRSTSLR